MAARKGEDCRAGVMEIISREYVCGYIYGVSIRSCGKIQFLEFGVPAFCLNIKVACAYISFLSSISDQ